MHLHRIDCVFVFVDGADSFFYLNAFRQHHRDKCHRLFPEYYAEMIVERSISFKIISPYWERVWEFIDSQNGVFIGDVWYPLPELKPYFMFVDNSLIDQFLFELRPGRKEKQLRITYCYYYGPETQAISKWKLFVEQKLDLHRSMMHMESLVGLSFHLL